MSDRQRQDWSDQQRRAQEAVGSLGRVSADPGFREHLRRRFVARALAEPEGSGAGPAGPARVLRPARRPWSWVPLAAAAVLAAVLVGLNPLPGPEVLGIEGTGTVQVDGRPFAAADQSGIAAALQAGSRVVLDDAVALDLIYPGSLAMRLEAGTDLQLPKRPGRWFARRVHADLPMGEVSIRTGPRLAGGAFHVTTPEGGILITGTLVSVYRNPDLTCVCLFEGSASVSTDVRDLGVLPPLKRWVMFSDGSEPALMPIEPTHQAHMLNFDDRWRTALGLE